MDKVIKTDCEQNQGDWLMIKIFDQTDKSFTSNGDVVLNPIKAIVHQKDNADYYLELECGLEYADYMTEGGEK